MSVFVNSMEETRFYVKTGFGCTETCHLQVSYHVLPHLTRRYEKRYKDKDIGKEVKDKPIGIGTLFYKKNKKSGKNI